MDYRTNLVRPAAVFADPSYTFSVPPFQTACGIVDIMSHSYEGYFSNSLGSIQDGFSEILQKTCIEHGRKVMMCPKDYESRAQLLWAAELAITHLADQGRDFVGNLHSTEKMLSGYFSLPHGAGIAIVSLAWFKYSLNDATAPRYARWGRNVWGIDGNQDERSQGRRLPNTKSLWRNWAFRPGCQALRTRWRRKSFLKQRTHCLGLLTRKHGLSPWKTRKNCWNLYVWPIRIKECYMLH